jgi:hypothetical protein
LSISVAPPGSFGSKLSLNAAELPKLDAEFEEITEGEELAKKEGDYHRGHGEAQRGGRGGK